NMDMREYVRRILEPRWRVDTAPDGEQALERIRRVPPSLVLADVMMPGLDGLELLARIRDHAATRTLPVILLSARAGEESRVEGMAAGADDYLVKPFSARELVARVWAHLELSRVREAAREQEREARRTAEEALAVQGQFMASVSH